MLKQGALLREETLADLM